MYVASATILSDSQLGNHLQKLFLPGALERVLRPSVFHDYFERTSATSFYIVSPHMAWAMITSGNTFPPQRLPEMYANVLVMASLVDAGAR